MLIGIKYCGGCNVQYDRAAQVEKLKQHYPQHTYVSGNEPCGLLLVVCGCARACPEIQAGNAKKYQCLCSEKDFRKFSAELKNKKDRERESSRIVITKGQKAQMKKRFGKEDVFNFAALTGDFSDLHVNEEFAKGQWFGQPVVHGVFVGSLISSIMGMKLPGPGTILVKEEIEFLKPVFFGDEITAQVEFCGYQEEKIWYMGDFTGKCFNQDGEVVIEAKVRQMMMKNLFCIKD